MRAGQLNAALKVVSDSPILGFGPAGLDDFLKKGTDLMGLESCWLQQIVFQGIIGVITYLIFILYLFKIRVNNKRDFSRFSFYYILAWVLFSTLTGEMFTRYFVLGNLLLLYKYYKLDSQLSFIKKALLIDGSKKKIYSL